MITTAEAVEATAAAVAVDTTATKPSLLCVVAKTTRVCESG